MSAMTPEYSNARTIGGNRTRLPCKSLARLLIVCGVVSTVCTGSLFAQDRKTASRDVELTASDGWPIRITYFPSSQGEEAPVVVLLHNKGGNRLVWEGDTGFAKRLQNQGYAAITVDLRKHGQSKGQSGNVANRSKKRKKGRKRGDSLDLRKADYQGMIEEDLVAVKEFIYDENQKKNLNMRKMAIVAPEMSAPVAIAFAFLDWQKKPYPDAPTRELETPRGQDVRALVLLSPEENLPGVLAGPALLQLRSPLYNVAFLTCYGSTDRKGSAVAKSIHKKLSNVSNPEKRMYLESYKTKLRGTDLLNRRLEVERHIRVFLERHLKGLRGSWRDRKSRSLN